MRHARLLAGFLLLVPSLLFAQAQGRIKGTVTDMAGKAIPGAKVTVTCPEISTYKKEITADKRGDFSVLFVDATKRYLFHIEAADYQTSEKTHKPPIAGETLNVDFKLKTVAEVQKEQNQQALAQPGYKELGEAKDALDHGMRDEARAKLKAAIVAKPDLYVAWHELARLDYEDKNWADAQANAEKCLELKPDDTPCLAIALNSSKEAGAKEAYERFLAAYKLANPSDPGMMFNEAAIYLNKGDDNGAKPILEKILESEPEYPDALFQLGMVYLRGGDNPKAKELLQKFLKVAPDHRDAPSATEMLKYL
jgi:tetratricopeptide (TPR) repeat protein